jgi:hypothetical protein
MQNGPLSAAAEWRAASSVNRPPFGVACIGRKASPAAVRPLPAKRSSSPVRGDLGFLDQGLIDDHRQFTGGRTRPAPAFGLLRLGCGNERYAWIAGGQKGHRLTLRIYLPCALRERRGRLRYPRHLNSS